MNWFKQLLHFGIQEALSCIFPVAFLGAWKYPNQMTMWQLVHLSKLVSWYLLVIISIIIVANLKHLKEGLAENSELVHGPSLPK